MQKFEISATRGIGSEPFTVTVEDDDLIHAVWLAGVQYGGGAAITAHETGILDMMLSMSDKDTMIQTLGMAAFEETLNIKEV